MKKIFQQSFRSALDESGSLAIGLIDGSGLLIHSAGAHNGQNAQNVAAIFANIHKHMEAVEDLLGDTFDDYIAIGEKLHIHFYRLENYTLYAFAPRKAGSGSVQVRNALRKLQENLKPLLQGGLAPQSDSAVRNGIQKPQQFGLR